MQSLSYALRNDVKQFKQFYLQVQSHLLDTKNRTKMSIILGRIQEEISLIFDEQQSDSGKIQVNTLKFSFTNIKTILQCHTKTKLCNVKKCMFCSHILHRISTRARVMHVFTFC